VENTNKNTNIAINGFGRIGRAITKINDKYNLFNLALINDKNPHIDNLAYLFKYDSTYGKFDGEVTHTEDSMIINGSSSACTFSSNLDQISWDQYSVDVLIDSSGIEKNIPVIRELIDQGKIKKAIITQSADKADNEVIMGVNDSSLTEDHNIVSNSICDANAIAHLVQWIDDEFGIEGGSLTTLHPWLSYQNLVDGPSISSSNPGVVWKDYALGRASAESLIPKNTTAMTAVEKVLPDLTGKILSFSYRIPTDIVSSSDITLNLIKEVNELDLLNFLKEKCKESKYVRINEESLVSQDYEQEEVSAVIDAQWLKALGKTIKIVLWYDNEWGYSARVLDLARKLNSL